MWRQPIAVCGADSFQLRPPLAPPRTQSDVPAPYLLEARRVGEGVSSIKLECHVAIAEGRNLLGNEHIHHCLAVSTFNMMLGASATRVSARTRARSRGARRAHSPSQYATCLC